MKKLYTGILGVALVLCLTSATLFSQTIPNWAPNTAYAVGALVMYQSVEYKCIQAHTSQVGWEPPNVPALWGKVSGTPTPTPTPTATPTPTPTQRRLPRPRLAVEAHALRHGIPALLIAIPPPPLAMAETRPARTV